MATNTLLTIDMITKRALATLHDRLKFPGLINRQYDSEFARGGAKIGDTLRIRKPARYTTATGATMTAQNSVEEQITLQASIQRHVGLEFGSKERTLSLDDYQARFLVPAMEQMASDMEKDVFSTISSVGNLVVASSQMSFKDALTAGAKMTAMTTPNVDRNLITTPFDQADLVDALKGLFQDSTQISKQYREGMFGRTAGFDWHSSIRIPTITIGADVAGAVSGNPTSGATSIAVTAFGANQVIQAGTVFTVAGVYAVSPETKDNLGYLYQFAVKSTVTLDGSGAGTLTIDPVYATGAQKSVSAMPTDTAVVTLAGSANTTYRQSIAFQKDAFTLASVDLEMPWGNAQASRQNMDGISMRVVQDYAIGSDQNICRVDVLYGYTTLRPEYACKIWVPNA